MSAIYKFRNMKSFLEYKELEDHYLYFSKIDKLNDPWEGNLSLEWNTDISDNWKGLLFNYFASFIWFYAKEIHNQENQPKNFESIDIVVFNNKCAKYDQYINTDLIKYLFDDFFVCKPVIKLRGTFGKSPLLRNQMARYFGFLYPTLIYFLKQYYDKLDESNNIPDEEIEDLPEDWRIPYEFRLSENNKPYYNEARLIGLKSLLSNDISEYEYKLNWLRYEFPYHYIDALLNVVTPNMYITCFSKTYDNSAMWAYYAGNHRGVCLVFEDDLVSELFDYKGTSLQDVNYSNDGSYGEFFQLLLDEIQDKLFYPKIDTSMYRNQDSFNDFWIKNSIRKSSYWMHESESRLLILSETSEGGIKIFYNPRCLKGIIFGANCSTEDKIKVIRILQDWKRESKIDELPRLYDIYFAESKVAPYKYKLELYNYDIL
ncbi:DUF2971 domain-containing protein [Veillonella atypica]|jgi:hypothetical protein|uniref:DUF2971 domain-containing protein n=1 Tax=Veillonella atypica TaxID=39777 RepID=UPI00352C6820